MKPSEILDKSADEVSRGWCQGDAGYYSQAEGNVCAMGAIWRTMGFKRVDEIEDHVKSDYVAIVDRLSLYVAGEVRVVARWNDKPGRTAGEVADAMRTVAKSLREEGE